ncbi:MAG: hypothetical protein NTV77_03045, partial [Candidatus Azambacteria bacterium]|nr:hypothetical protein [Candidatus Azambacteria bacterium]
LYILIFIIFFPVLFLKKLFPGFDPLLVFYPYSFHFLHSQSFWASGILSGFNISATPSGFAGNWIYYFFANGVGFRFFDFITFYNFIIFFYFILTVIFSYLAARMLNFDKWISVLIASVYIFSAYNLSWMVNIVTAASLFVFPAIIYFLLKFKNIQNWLWPTLGGLTLGLSLITSHPQFALIGVFGGFLFSLFLVFGSGAKPKWIFLVAFLVVCLIGLALASFQLLPEYQLSKLTQRGAALSFQDSQECALGIPDFTRYLIPNFNFGVSCESLLYVGILPLIFAIFTVVYMKKDKHVIFWSLLLAFTLLFSIKYSPLAWVFHQLPIWSGLRGPARFVMLGNFTLAVLSGHGFNWILENKESFKKSAIFWWIKKIFLGFISVIIVVNVLSLFKDAFIQWAQVFFNRYYYAKTIGLPLEHYHRAIENFISGNFYTFSFLNKDFTIPFVLTISAFLIIIFIYKFNRTALFYVVLLSGFTWAISSPMVSSGLSRDFFDETSIINFLKSQKNDPFRVYSLMPNLSTYQLLVLEHSGVTEMDENEFFKTLLPPNLNLIYGLDSIDGYDVSMPRRTARLLSEILSERATLGNKIAEAKLKPEEKIKIFESQKNLISMMNVKYIISAYPLNDNIFKKVFETETTRFRVPIYIYENPDVMPRFYFVERAIFINSGDEEKALQNILKPDINFSAEAFIECGDSEDCGQNKNIGGKIVSYKYENGYLRLDTESRTGGWLIFSESFDNNWQVKINGLAVPIYRANYVYQAIKVPAGKNIVEFNYTTLK